MKYFLLIAVIFGQINLLYAKKMLHSFDDLIKPRQIIVYKSKIYIAEMYKIRIYDRKNYHFIKEIGNKGAGPMEMPGRVIIKINNHQLMVNSLYRTLWFDLDGKPLRMEKRHLSAMRMFPLKNGNMAKSEYTMKGVDHKLIDKNGHLIKYLYKCKKGNGFFKGKIYLHADEKHLIMGDSRGKGEIKLLDHNGTFVRKLSPPFPLDRKITPEYKKDRDYDWASELGQYKDAFLKNKKDNYPKYFPAYNYISSDSLRIYVYLDQPIYNEVEIWSISKLGQVLNKKIVYRGECHWINEGIYYTLIENDDEEWELYSFYLLK